MVVELIKNAERYIIRYQMVDAASKEEIGRGIDEGDLVNFHVFYDNLDYDVIHVEQVGSDETYQGYTGGAAARTLLGIKQETKKVKPFSLAAFPFLESIEKTQDRYGFYTYKNGSPYFINYRERVQFPQEGKKAYKTYIDVYGTEYEYYVIFQVNKKDTTHSFHCAYDQNGSLVAIVEELPNESAKSKHSKLYLQDKQYLELGMMMLGYYVMADQCLEFESGLVKGSDTGKLDEWEAKSIPEIYRKLLDEEFMKMA